MLPEVSKKISEILEKGLKPCPFCGGGAEFITHVENDEFVNYVRCRICYTFNGFGKIRGKFDNGEDTGNEMLAALNSWNKRA